MSKKRTKKRKPSTQTQQPMNRGYNPAVRVVGTVGFVLIAVALIGSMIAGSASF